MAAQLPDECKHDEDIFRLARLYRVRVAFVLKENESWLKQIYKHYAQSGSDGANVMDGNEAKLLSCDEWCNFCHDAGLVDDKVTEREIRLCYTWSQTYVYDEIKKRSKLTNATIIDFYESICRVCTFKAMPTQSDLDKLGLATAKEYFDADQEGLIEEDDRLPELDYRVEEVRPPNEPLYPALETLLSVMFARFDQDGDGKIGKDDLKQLANGVEGARQKSAAILLARSKKNVQEASPR